MVRWSLPLARSDHVPPSLPFVYLMHFLLLFLLLDPAFSAKGLVARLLIHSPLQRSTIYQALQSAWITEDLSELENAYQARVGSG
jgi:hypothetical protein